MPCTDPKKAWQSGLTENGKAKMVFKCPEGREDEDPILLPCGHCTSCKLAYSAQWATRIYHEIQTCGDSCFLTLTYSDQNMPENDSVSLREVQLFMKKLRKLISPKKIKFIAAGEYGDKKGRPHYHLILLGHDFADAIWHSRTPSGGDQYRSPTLEKLWTKGFSAISEANHKTAGYLARYCFKKAKNDRKKGFVLVEETGQAKTPEFITMSGGIGLDWWKKYKSDTYKDYLNVDYGKAKVPRYYDKKLDEAEPERLAEIKERRMAHAAEKQLTKHQMKMENTVKTVQTKMLKRGLESNG